MKVVDEVEVRDGRFQKGHETVVYERKIKELNELQLEFFEWLKSVVSINVWNEYEEKYIRRVVSYIDVRKEGECWKWEGYDVDDYGQIQINGKWIKVHRLIYILVNGSIPEDNPIIMHTCNNPLCCNPKHLEAGTPLKNAQYRHECGRDAKGEDGGNSKVNWIAVNGMRDDYKTGLTYEMICEKYKEYNISITTISSIIRNETWFDENYIPELRSGHEGENSVFAKSTWEEVNRLREDYKNGKLISELCMIYNKIPKDILDTVAMNLREYEYGSR